jgi:hypothetical protein
MRSARQCTPQAGARGPQPGISSVAAALGGLPVRGHLAGSPAAPCARPHFWVPDDHFSLTVEAVGVTMTLVIAVSVNNATRNRRACR